jgi:hypothetical protein
MINSYSLSLSFLAILKINGDALLETHDDGAFINVLKHYFSQLNEPLYPDSDNLKAKHLTVSEKKKKTTLD